MSEGNNKIRVRLVTPERILFEEFADAVELPSTSGYLEVLYGAAPLVAELGAGDVTVHGGSQANSRYNVSWGFAEVLPERVTILANDALLHAAIDVPRAQKQLERGHELWHAAGDNVEAYIEAQRVINEAEAKLASAAAPAAH